MKFELLSENLKKRLLKIKPKLKDELLNIANTEEELNTSLTLVEAVLESIASLTELTIEYRKLNHVRKRALFIQENIEGKLLGVLNTDDLLTYQDNYLNSMEVEDTFVNPLPLILASLDKHLVIFQDPQSFISQHKEVLNSAIEKAVNRHTLKSIDNKPISYRELKKELKDAGFKKVPTKLYPKIKKGFKGIINSDKVKELLIDFNRKEASKFWKENKEKILKFYPNLKNFTYKNMLEEYFEGFKLSEGPNSPKLSKQLSKQGFEPTDKELQYFGEVKDYFEHLYLQGIDKKLGNEKNVPLLLVDTVDFNIPQIVDAWAFAGSCHKEGSAGQDSHLAMDYLGFSFLKAYTVGVVEGDLILRKQYRSYFYEKDGEIAHAGGYSNTTHKNNKTAYEFTTVLYCVLFDKKIDDFKKIRGADLPEGRVYDKGEYRSLVLWCNMSDRNEYLTLGTSEILQDVSFTEKDVGSAKNYRDITEEFSYEQIADMEKTHIRVTEGE